MQQQQAPSQEQTAEKPKRNKGNKQATFPYYVAHQKLVLDVDLADEVIAGYTDVYFVGTSEMVPQLKLHCHPQIQVSSAAYLVTKDYDFMDVESDGIYEQPKILIEQIRPTFDDNVEKVLKNVATQFRAEQELLDQGSLIITLDRPLLKGWYNTL